MKAWEAVGDRLYTNCKAAKKKGSSFGPATGHRVCGGDTYVTEEEWKSAGADDEERAQQLVAAAKSACDTGCDCWGSVSLIITDDAGTVEVQCNDGSSAGRDVVIVTKTM